MLLRRRQVWSSELRNWNEFRKEDLTAVSFEYYLPESANTPACAYAGQERTALKTQSKIYLSFGTLEALIRCPYKENRPQRDRRHFCTNTRKFNTVC